MRIVRFLAAAAVIAACTVPVKAEQSQAMDQADVVRAKKNKEADDAYKAVIKNQDNSKVKEDPWANTRAPTAPAPGKTK